MIHNGFKSARPLARLRAGRADWYRIENKSDSPTEIYIYDEIGYVGVSAKEFVQDLNKVKDSEIILHLDTPGGDVYDGISIYNAIRDHRAHVTVVVDSIAASAGSFIAQAGDHRVMNRGSQMMIHKAQGLAVGNSNEMVEYAAFLEKQSLNIAEIYASRAGQDAAYWLAAMDAETWYMGQEAVDAGLADEMAGREAQSQNSFDLSVFSYAGREKAPAPIAEPDPEPEMDWAALASTLGKAFV